MDSNEVRDRFLKFFEKRGHKIIPSASLVPEGDSSVLFTTAGMQQFKPYYTGAKDALKDFGIKNVVSVQKCIRTGDIDEVGDDTHLTFFEMLGNFSFGGYGKKEAIEYAHEFITKELGLRIDYVSIFRTGKDSSIPTDEESRQIWKTIDSEIEIREHPSADNFWGPTGGGGPCGPTTEIYVNGVEIWNIVFNEYFCEKSREELEAGRADLVKLKTLGIDTGMGLERLLVQVQKKENVYETDLFNNEKTREERIVADHVKASLFMISDGVVPANTGRGYVLRRLIRRAVRFSKKPLQEEVERVNKIYKGVYTLDDKGEIEKEENKFRETLERGMRIFNIKEKGIKLTKDIDKSVTSLNGERIFELATVYGFPLELSIEVATEKGIPIGDGALDIYKILMNKHRKLSQTASAGMFKGGLANHEEKTIKLHTAHHLLLAGLKAVVDKNIKQRGSNITEDRLRIDFLFDRKLTDEEKKKVEDWVNDKIKSGFTVVQKNMPLAEAEKLGAEMEFGAKYPDVVSVYLIVPMPEASRIHDGEAIGKDIMDKVISKEFCGGPHVSSSNELGVFKIQKEEAVASGIRRIRAHLI